MAVAELRVPHGPLVPGAVDDPPVPGVPVQLVTGPAGPWPAGVQPPGPDRSGAPVLGRLRGAAWRHDRHEAHVLELGELGAEVVDSPAPLMGGKVGPGHHAAVHERLARSCLPAAARLARIACRPPGREPPLVPAGVLAAGDGLQVLLAQLDEAAGHHGPAGNPSPPRGHHLGHDGAELQDVVLADEAVQVGPGTAGQRPGIRGPGRMAEAVALVPVPGHPGPGVLG